MKEVVRVTRDFNIREQSCLYLDKSFYKRGDVLEDEQGKQVVILNNLGEINNNETQYLISSRSNEWFSSPVGSILTWVKVDDKVATKDYLQHIFIPDKIRTEKIEYGGGIESFMEQDKISKLLYLEEDLVPSQFFGLNDYLKSRI